MCVTKPAQGMWLWAFPAGIGLLACHVLVCYAGELLLPGL